VTPQPAVSVAAGLVLALFAGLGALFIRRFYAAARYLLFGYVAMGAGGVLCAVWGVTNVLGIGVVAAACVAIGGIAGAIGALRKELRSETL
jgi:FAD/FMN-containing dehydrogenase